MDTREIFKEIKDRIREELDYGREARHARLYEAIFKRDPLVRVPAVRPELSTGRLLALEWLDGTRLLEHKVADLATPRANP